MTPTICYTIAWIENLKSKFLFRMLLAFPSLELCVYVWESQPKCSMDGTEGGAWKGEERKKEGRERGSELTHKNKQQQSWQAEDPFLPIFHEKLLKLQLWIMNSAIHPRTAHKFNTDCDL